MADAYSTLLIERHQDGYAVVTLNRSEALNALNSILFGELATFIEATFQPSLAAVKKVLAVVKASGSSTGTIRLDGQMLDRPHLVAAKRILASSGLQTTSPSAG